jgi:hypothetical protein
VPKIEEYIQKTGWKSFLELSRKATNDQSPARLYGSFLKKRDTLTGLLLLDSHDRTIHGTARRRAAHALVALFHAKP